MIEVFDLLAAQKVSEASYSRETLQIGCRKWPANEQESQIDLAASAAVAGRPMHTGQVQSEECCAP